MTLDISGYFKRGRETDNVIKMVVKLERVNVNPEEEEKKKKEEMAKKKKSKQEEAEKDDKFTKEYKAIDIFHKYYGDFFSRMFLNKTKRKSEKKELLPIPLNNIKVRVYILRCLNLTAQDDSSSLLVKLAGMSAFSKANSFIEIVIGDEQQ